MAGRETGPGRMVVVTGGDAKYYPLVSELISSLRRFPEARELSIAVLDGGLGADQVAALESDGCRVIEPDWPSPEIAERCRGREHLRIELAKPRLDRMFPDHEVILWLDGDTWVQTWDAIPIYVEVAARGRLAVVSQASRLQNHHIAMRRRLFGWVEPRGILFKNAIRAGLPKSLAWSLVNRPVLNAGVYALRQDAPHWARWRTWRDEALKKGRVFTAGQLALALTVYEDGLPYDALPESCNYMGPWRVDTERGALVSHFAPYDPVSIVHLVAQEEMRANPEATVAARDCDDREIQIPLRYPGFTARFGGGDGENADG